MNDNLLMFYCLLWIYFTTFSSVSIVDFTLAKEVPPHALKFGGNFFFHAENDTTDPYKTTALHENYILPNLPFFKQSRKNIKFYILFILEQILSKRPPIYIFLDVFMMPVTMVVSCCSFLSYWYNIMQQPLIYFHIHFINEGILARQKTMFEQILPGNIFCINSKGFTHTAQKNEVFH